MKKMRRIVSGILVFALCFSLGITAFASTFYLKTYVDLEADMNEAYSSAAFGRIGYGKISNNPSSAGGAGVALEISDGSGWTEAVHAEADPGATASTVKYGLDTTDYLFRVKAYSTTYWYFGNPGRVAKASLYTDISQ